MSKSMPKGLSVRTQLNKTIYQLYKTDIVEIDHSSNCVRLNTGGWKTAHTKKCMNLALNEFGYKVYQTKGDWFIDLNNGTKPIRFDQTIQVC